MMKRKVALLGLAMMTGMPHVVCAKGIGKVNSTASDSYGVSSYLSRLDGPTPPLMAHLSAPDPHMRRGTTTEWQVELAPLPAVAHRSDDPLMARDKRVGVTFKLDF